MPVSRVAVIDSEPKSISSAAVPARGVALLVDDEKLVRFTTAHMLADLGYDVVEAGSAEEALTLIGNGVRPDVVVTDHLLTGMSGADLARELKAKRAGLPVLIISGYADAEGISPDVARLTKPFCNAELAETLASLVGSPPEQSPSKNV